MSWAEIGKLVSRHLVRAHLWILALFLASSPVPSCRSRPEEEPKGTSEEQRLREQIATLTRLEEILSAEVSVAKNPAPYLVFDFPGRKTELRVRGRSLRAFPIQKIVRSDDEAFSVVIWEVTAARPLKPSTRAKMRPGSGEEAASSIAKQDPWGPQKMPIDYDLICKGGRLIAIRSLPSAESHWFLTRWILAGFRRVRHHVRNLFSGGSAYQKRFEIWLPEDQAQLLFWSIPKQFRILIVNNAS